MFLCPPKPTLMVSIKNNQLATWPGLIIRVGKKYLQNHAHHTKRHKKGIRSTEHKMKEDLESMEVKMCINPTLEQEQMN